QRPLKGHHHLGRREHLVDRGRGGAVSPPAGYGSGGGCPTGRRLGRNPMRLYHAETGRGAGFGSRYHRVRPRPPRAFQSPENRGVRPTAQDLDRQGAKIRAARSGEGHYVVIRFTPNFPIFLVIVSANFLGISCLGYLWQEFYEAHWWSLDYCFTLAIPFALIL